MSVLTEGLGGLLPGPDLSPPVRAIRGPVKETLTPDPDGTRREFWTSQPFKPGTISVWLNGVRKMQSWENGFLEIWSTEGGIAGVLTEGLGVAGEDEVLDGQGGIGIQMKEAPLPGDSLQAQYEVA